MVAWGLLGPDQRGNPTACCACAALPMNSVPLVGAEVANMVAYVCSPQASATTGAALRVDGGVVRSIA
jgi:NAD(P)-dependent dehydrogenase (short-subunit alcohol dehydrogenase family)